MGSLTIQSSTLEPTPSTSCAASIMSSATAPTPQTLPPGVYVPMLAFFTPSTDDIDIAATQRHAIRLANAGVAGLVVHGSNGEAAHLSRDERTTIIKAVVDAVRTEVEHSLPIIAGCGAQSVVETVQLCREAAEAGATHALVLPPGYYANLIGKAGTIHFFEDVAARSPIPVLVYNFPAAANGVDLTSDDLLKLAERCPNVMGVKLTCGNTGKLCRVAAAASKLRNDDFFVFGGSADFILQGAIVGAHGTISGLANLAPRACVRILELVAEGRFAEARAMQAEVASADWLMIKYGFVGVKAAMPMFHGVQENAACEPRQPLVRLEGSPLDDIREGMRSLVDVETALAKTTETQMETQTDRPLVR